MKKRRQKRNGTNKNNKISKSGAEAPLFCYE